MPTTRTIPDTKMAADLEQELVDVVLSPAAPATECAHLPEFARLICQGRFGLAIEAAWRSVLGEEIRKSASKGAAGSWFEKLANRVHESTESNEQAGEWLGLAVAALLLVAQANVTGPSPRPEVAALVDRVFADGVDGDTRKEWEQWARTELASDGEEVIVRIEYTQYLVLSVYILRSLRKSPCCPQTAGWWLGRALLTVQRVLSGRSPSLHNEILEAYDDAITKIKKWYSHDSKKESRLLAALELELALCEQVFALPAESEKHLRSACDLQNLNLEVAGAKGYRTQHQQEAKSQLIVSSSQSEEIEENNGSDSEEYESWLEDEFEAEEESKRDVFPAPKLEGSIASELVQESNKLSTLQQLTILAYAMQAKKEKAIDDLTSWEMTPFVDVIARTKHHRPMVLGFCLLQRARHEQSRGRTRERALLRFHRLIEWQKLDIDPITRANQLEQSDEEEDISAVVRRRIRYCFTSWFPIASILRKEFGNLLVSLGIVSEAIDLFEAIELWESVILCYRMLEKVPAATALIRKQLEVYPDDPRLWCALGDVTKEDKHYVTAWEKSRGRHARAQRSLARNAMIRDDFVAACEHWEEAVKVSPLHEETWFAFGYAAVKKGDYDRALEAFSRAVHLEPTNGEALNNIAAIHIQRGNLQPAYVALQESLRHQREKWQTWDNFALVAIQTCHYSQAVEAVGHVLRMGKRFDVVTVKKVIDAIAQQMRSGSVESTDSEKEKIPERELTRLRTNLEEVFKQVIASPVINKKPIEAAAIWEQYGRLKEMSGDNKGMTQCLLKACRALRETQWASDEDDFIQYGKFLCRLARGIVSAQPPASPDAVGVKMEIRSVLKQSEERFEDHEVYKSLQVELQSFEQ